MTVPPAASLIDLLTRLVLAPTDAGPFNRCAIEGLRWTPRDDGAIEAAIDTLEATGLRLTLGPLALGPLALGPLALELDRAVVHQLSVQLRVENGRLRPSSLEAAAAELSGVRFTARLAAPEHGRAGHATAGATTGRWCLGPLEQAEGTVHGTITDAQLLFDAKVFVPIRQGQIEFNDTRVEHIGPDSRMGISKLGIYVDAPTGRSYLYQFASAPLVGVGFERRDAVFGPWVSERGRLWLKAFGEALLDRADMGQHQGLTAQARLLLGRTALSGELQLGDAAFALPGLTGRTEGSAQGRNKVALSSKAVGEGLGVALADLSVHELVMQVAGLRAGCDELSAKVNLDLAAAEPDIVCTLALEDVRMARLRLEG